MCGPATPGPNDPLLLEVTDALRSACPGLSDASIEILIEAAEEVRDQASADLATRRLDVHEKNAWMLRSHLE